MSRKGERKHLAKYVEQFGAVRGRLAYDLAPFLPALTGFATTAAMHERWRKTITSYVVHGVVDANDPPPAVRERLSGSDIARWYLDQEKLDRDLAQHLDAICALSDWRGVIAFLDEYTA